MSALLTLEEVGSTNSYLRELLDGNHKLEEGFIVSSKFQTAGRGQIGNVWVSDPGKNLTFSMLLYPTHISPSSQFVISQIVSLGIYETLTTLFPDGIGRFSIKWPNDIYWEEKKLGGVLIENLFMGSSIQNSIVGIGLNINQSSFPEHLPNPISFFEITHREHDLDAFLLLLRQSILKWYSYSVGNDYRFIQEQYLQHLFRYNTESVFTDESEEFIARIIGVEPDGQLLLQLRDASVRKYYFKEVFFKDLRNG